MGNSFINIPLVVSCSIIYTLDIIILTVKIHSFINYPTILSSSVVNFPNDMALLSIGFFNWDDPTKNGKLEISLSMIFYPTMGGTIMLWLHAIILPYCRDIQLTPWLVPIKVSVDDESAHSKSHLLDSKWPIENQDSRLQKDQFLLCALTRFWNYNKESFYLSSHLLHPWGSRVWTHSNTTL